ncbi:MAG: hypothetical protein CMP21_08675 [Rickettsiales bacterium]|nr:hypothetical protein [Rickettsiales bacterium]|tara:strand:+ start:1279 stop:2025 length:747 start_codon:yes stop_codon:yes gene_type:complete
MLKDIFTLLQIHKKELRVGGVPTIILSLIIPLGILFVIKFIGIDDSESIKKSVIKGTLIVSCMNSIITMIAHKIILLRKNKGLDFYLTLPTTQAALYVSIIVAFVLFRLPITLVLFVISKMLLGLPLALTDLFFALPNLIMLFFFGYLGMVIGISITELKLASTISTLLASLIIALTPVYYPLENLSGIHKSIVIFTPIPYISNLLDCFFDPSAFDSLFFLENLGIFMVFFILVSTLLVFTKRREVTI